MVHLNAHQDEPEVSNYPHQHAFVIVGYKALFGVHMTQYHCEVHKYQIILRLKLPKEIRQRLNEIRQAAPHDCFVLCNAKEDKARGISEFTVPDLASGARPEFLGNIFQGMRPITVAPTEHFFPWSSDRCRPVFEEVPVEIERIVLFRPFSHHEIQPDCPGYYLWGDSGETHMTNLQTAALATNPFKAAAYGPDYDHVMSLLSPPKWLDPALMKAGIVVSTPDIQLHEPEGIPQGPPFPEGAAVRVLYRGVAPTRTVVAGPTFFSGTAVCNSPETDPYKGKNLYISAMPREFWT